MAPCDVVRNEFDFDYNLIWMKAYFIFIADVFIRLLNSTFDKSNEEQSVCGDGVVNNPCDMQIVLRNEI